LEILAKKQLSTLVLRKDSKWSLDIIESIEDLL